MYMGPIVAEVEVAVEVAGEVAAEAAAPPAAHSALRMAVGVPVLLLAALVALPWIAVVAVSAGAMLALRGERDAGPARTPRALARAADHAGRIALGR